MCFRQSRRYFEEDVEEVRGRRLWDLFYRETETTEPPLPVMEQEEERPAGDPEREEVATGAGR
jgi:hypothetical protein